MESARVGKRGAIVVPAKLRKHFGIEEGSVVTAEAREDGILIRPAVIVPIERYTPERKAEFLLSTATNPEDYRRARKQLELCSRRYSARLPRSRDVSLAPQTSLQVSSRQSRRRARVKEPLLRQQDETLCIHHAGA